MLTLNLGIYRVALEPSEENSLNTEAVSCPSFGGAGKVSLSPIERIIGGAAIVTSVPFVVITRDLRRPGWLDSCATELMDPKAISASVRSLVNSTRDSLPATLAMMSCNFSTFSTLALFLLKRSSVARLGSLSTFSQNRDHSRSFWIAMISVIIWTFGEIIFMPLNSATPINMSEKSNRGEYMSYFWMTWSVVNIVAPVVGLSFMDFFGYDAFWFFLLRFYKSYSFVRLD